MLRIRFVTTSTVFAMSGLGLQGSWGSLPYDNDYSLQRLASRHPSWSGIAHKCHSRTMIGLSKGSPYSLTYSVNTMVA